MKNPQWEGHRGESKNIIACNYPHRGGRIARQAITTSLAA